MQNVASRKYRDWFSKRALCCRVAHSSVLGLRPGPLVFETIQASGSWYDNELSLERGSSMKVSNNQTPSEGDEGVSRKTLNDWQRKGADLQKQDEAAQARKPGNQVGKQAEG